MARKGKHVQVLEERIAAEEARLKSLQADVDRSVQLLSTLVDVRNSFLEASPRRKKVTA